MNQGLTLVLGARQRDPDLENIVFGGLGPPGAAQTPKIDAFRVRAQGRARKSKVKPIN